jgi:ABC-2 type transport system ATP-binding protein
VTAFLGPNGAGKSTTMKILTGLLSPASGTAKIAGFDIREQRLEATRRLGYLPENGPLYPDMTPQSLLEFFGAARGLTGTKLRERLDEVIARCHLSTVIEKPIRKLSKGFRQRTGMAQALLHEPDVLILDEPTTGLDPNQIHEVRRLIRELGQNKTVLLSTHILQEVDAMADRVIFIHQGRIIFDGTPSEMKSDHANLDEAFRAMTAAKPSAEEAATAL